MLNLRWSWHLPTGELFQSIDPAGWAASGGDPVAMLSSLRPAQLAELAASEEFVHRLNAAVEDLRGYTSEPRWYQSAVSAGTAPAGTGDPGTGDEPGGAGEAGPLPRAIA